MKPYYSYIIILLLLNSCILDSFDPLFNISNNSNQEIRIYFSNTANMKAAILEGKSAIISPHDMYFPVKGVSIFNKKDYADTSKKLHLFIFDNVTFDQLKTNENLEKVAEKSFLEIKLINIRDIMPKDTIFYEGSSK